MALLDSFRFQLPVSFQARLCSMPVLILKHRLEFGGISHVISLYSFSNVKAFREKQRH